VGRVADHLRCATQFLCDARILIENSFGKAGSKPTWPHRNLEASKAPLESQAQGTSLFTSTESFIYE